MAATPETTTAPQAPDEASARDLISDSATALAMPFALARQLLPESALPVALGTGALAVAGVIEWPTVAAIGLGYLAVRHWRRPRPSAGLPA